jgi:hypothetical protein
MSNSTVIAKHFVIARSAATKQAPVIAKPEGLKQSSLKDCFASLAMTNQPRVIAKPEGLKQSLPVDCFGLRPRNDNFAVNDE